MWCLTLSRLMCHRDNDKLCPPALMGVIHQGAYSFGFFVKGNWDWNHWILTALWAAESLQIYTAWERLHYPGRSGILVSTAHLCRDTKQQFCGFFIMFSLHQISIILLLFSLQPLSTESLGNGSWWGINRKDHLCPFIKQTDCKQWATVIFPLLLCVSTPSQEAFTTLDSISNHSNPCFQHFVWDDADLCWRHCWGLYLTHGWQCQRVMLQGLM